MTSRDDLTARCAFRRELPDQSDGVAVCGLIERLCGTGGGIDARVSSQACESCLQRPPAGPGRINAVVASLLHSAIATTGVPERQADFHSAELRFLRAYAAKQLDLVETDGTLCDGSANQAPIIRNEQSWSGARLQDWLKAICRTALLRRKRRREWPLTGLVGWNDPTGLGYQNRGIAAHLPIAKWLIPRDPSQTRRSSLPIPLHLRGRSWQPRDNPQPHQLRKWLAGLDWLLFVESPPIPGLAAVAKQVGVRVACVCNWEWTCPLSSIWLRDVDLLICPTRYTWERMQYWNQRFGFEWQLVYVPWPIDFHHIGFRQREICRRLVFIHGTGGCRARYANGQATPYRRKGLEVVFAAARLASHVPIIVYSQSVVPLPPANVEVRLPPADNAMLYQDGDVCVQPSHWEGLGLPLLECQAAGMPLITTDSPPMNEHNPFRTVPLSKVEPVYLAGAYPVPSCLMDPRNLASVMGKVFHTRIDEASEAARRFIETEHAWGGATGLLQHAFQSREESCAV
jgi:hypothetical protein